MKTMRFVAFLLILFCALFITSCDMFSESVRSTAPPQNNITPPPEPEKCSHNYISVAGKEPTCTENGYSAHKVCTICDEKEGYVKIEGGHDYVTVPEKPATDVTPGHSEYRECSRCKVKDGYVEFPASHTHSLTEHAEGETNPLFYTCSCGFSVVSELRSRPLIDQLTDAQYKNFLSLYNMFKNRERSCTFASSINQAEADTFRVLLQGQCPELFLIDYENSSFALTSLGASWNPGCMSAEKFDETCQIMIDTMIKWDADCYELNDVEKMKYMIRWLNENTVYSSIGTRVRSLYGGIIDREIACVGYSQVFAWAMAHFGIPCMSVNGFIPSSNEGHMWNLVQLDDKWYQVDPGWGTVEFNGTNYTHYAYLNVTDSALGIGSGRVYSDFYKHCGIEIPACDSTNQNAARLDGCYIEKSEHIASTFESALKNTLNRGEDVFTIVCANESIMKSLYSHAQNGGNIAAKYGLELFWFSSNHDERTNIYFVSILLARPNFDEIKLETPNFEEGVGYKLALRQNQNGQIVFFSGRTTGKYLSTVADPDLATTVFFKNVNGGFRIWFMDGYMKKFVDIFVNDSGAVQAGVSLNPTAIFNIDSATGAIVATVNGEKYWLGTYNSFTTIGASLIKYITGENASKLNVSQYPAQLVTVAGQEPIKMIEPPIPEGKGTAYKLVMDQNKLGKKLYFEGWRTRNFPASTTDREKSPNIYLEESESGYQLYYLLGENKMYINVQGFGADGVSIQLQPIPGAPFKYNESLGLYTVEMYGEEYYIGCYSQYDTFSISNISYITGENAKNVGVTQFPAYLEKVN